MRLPQFTAEESLARSGASFQTGLADAQSGAAGVLPALPVCGNCETVGGFGGIRGVGRMSCCERVCTVIPGTTQLQCYWNCWFQSCSPEVTSNAWMSF